MTALAALLAGALLTVPARNPVPHFVKKVDVGGYKLAIECSGNGSPTVVLESGFSTPRSAWYWVVPKLRRTTRVCSYDRAGLGQSQQRPDAITPTTAQVVDELHTLLQRANLPRPMSSAAGRSEASTSATTSTATRRRWPASSRSTAPLRGGP